MQKLYSIATTAVVSALRLSRFKTTKRWTFCTFAVAVKRTPAICSNKKIFFQFVLNKHSCLAPPMHNRDHKRFTLFIAAARRLQRLQFFQSRSVLIDLAAYLVEWYCLLSYRVWFGFESTTYRGIFLSTFEVGTMFTTTCIGTAYKTNLTRSDIAEQWNFNHKGTLLWYNAGRIEGPVPNLIITL